MEKALRLNPMNAQRRERKYECWYYYDKYGEKHRDGDYPAIDCDDGSQVWYQHGKTHRDGDKPAVILANGCKRWYKNDKFIKEEGC